MPDGVPDGRQHTTYDIEFHGPNPLSTLYWLAGLPTHDATNAFRAVWVQAGPVAAKKFHDELYADQPSEEGPFPDDDWLVEKAVAAGADEAKVRPAIEDMDFQDWVDGATKEASIVKATPTVYVNGKILETSTLDEKAAKLLTMIG